MNSRGHTVVPADILEMFEGVPETAEIVARMKANEVDLDADPEFVAGYLKAQFVEDIYKAMEKQNLNRNQLAKKLGKSRQYVGKILNEKANFTLETLAEIACALDMRVTARMFSSEERMAILPIVEKSRILRLSEFVPETKPVSGESGGKDAGDLAA